MPTAHAAAVPGPAPPPRHDEVNAGAATNRRRSGARCAATGRRPGAPGKRRRGLQPIRARRKTFRLPSCRTRATKAIAAGHHPPAAATRSASCHRMAACHKGLRLKSRDFAEQTPFDHFFNSDHWPSTCFMVRRNSQRSRQLNKAKAMKVLICFAESSLKEIWAHRFAMQVAAGST